MTRRLRLWAGLVLFAYVATHLANHSLGLISLQAIKPRSQARRRAAQGALRQP